MYVIRVQLSFKGCIVTVRDRLDRIKGSQGFRAGLGWTRLPGTD